jgi:uncharacterized membrane protein YkvA (DUF1232 family)
MRASPGTAIFAHNPRMNRWWVAAREWARSIKRDVVALWYAARDPRVPWYAKAVAACVVAYALSPIDLIPDFIPVLGYLDEVILLPALIWFTVRLLPPEVLQSSREQAERWMAERAAQPRSWAAGVAIVVIWLLVAVVLSRWAITALER